MSARSPGWPMWGNSWTPSCANWARVRPPPVLFNSREFLFYFLPAVFGVYAVLQGRRPNAALAWLVVASLVFYARGAQAHVLLLLASIGFNFLAARAIASPRDFFQRHAAAV